MKEFNMIIVGVGGQGILTASHLVAEAALIEGFDVKMSELHGLSQRGGSVPCHIRFGEKIYSSLIRQGNADLIIALEPIEALRTCFYASKQKTKFLVNQAKIVPLSVYVANETYPTFEEIKEKLKEFSSEVIMIPFSKIVKEKFGTTLPENIFMLAYACSKRLLPLKKESLLEGMKKVIRPKYLELNQKVFEEGFNFKE